jgi:hypothetical protein
MPDLDFRAVSRLFVGGVEASALYIGGAPAWATAAAPAAITAFLVAGQSNATSRAPFDGGADYPTDGTVLQVRRSADASDGEIINAVRPLDHHTAPQAGGMGWALQFALDYTAATGKRALLIPTAHGGTGFSDNRWNPGDDLHADAVARTNAVLAANPGIVLGGILWHQGENDRTWTQSQYATALDAAMAAFRSNISAASSSTPIIVGQIGDFWTAPGPQAALSDTPNRIAYSAFVDAAGLAEFDGAHFDAAGMRVLGSRYYTALATAAANAPTVPGAPTSLSVTPGDGQLSLTWTPPANNGLSAITDYVIERSAGAEFVAISDGVSTNTSFVDTTVTNGTQYTYRVEAVNGLGTGAPSLTAAATPVAAPSTGAEAGASGHWLLGSDGSTLSGGSLTTVGAAPELNAGYARWSSTQRRGYDTGIPDASTIAYWAVARLPTFGSNVIFGGNNDLSTGRIMFGVSADAIFRLRTDPGANLYDIDSNIPTNTWLFLAVSLSGSSFVGYRGASTGAVTSVTTVNPGTLKGNIGISNIGLNNAAVANELEVAEFGVFSAAKSVSEWDAVYARSASRLAARGVTLA